MKKNILLVATLVVIMASFVACKDAGAVETPVASEPASSSEVPSEEVSSEEVSEEASSEEVAVSFSADEVMKHIDELTAKYQYNNPEHIKALVIAANLDYISAEDLDIILNTYGYTIEDLAALYDECILDNSKPLDDTFDYYKGNISEIAPEHEYHNRITLQSACLNKEDAEAAKWFDTFLIEFSTCRRVLEKEEELFAVILSPDTNIDELSSFEKTCYNYTSGVYLGNFEYAHYIPSPYYGYQ